MNLQIIKSLNGENEYVLLPIDIYTSWQKQIKGNDYVTFDLKDYVDNPVALARIKLKITQETLAKQMDVTQAYISKLEAQAKVSAKVLQKVNAALEILVGRVGIEPTTN